MNNLPNDLQSKIISKLKPKNRCTFAQVDKRRKSLINDFRMSKVKKHLLKWKRYDRLEHLRQNQKVFFSANELSVFYDVFVDTDFVYEDYTIHNNLRYHSDDGYLTPRHPQLIAYDDCDKLVIFLRNATIVMYDENEIRKRNATTFTTLKRRLFDYISNGKL